MKISELVTKLEEVKKEHGDLLVYVDGYNFGHITVQLIEYIEMQKRVPRKLSYGVRREGCGPVYTDEIPARVVIFT